MRSSLGAPSPPHGSLCEKRKRRFFIKKRPLLSPDRRHFVSVSFPSFDFKSSLISTRISSVRVSLFAASS